MDQFLNERREEYRNAPLDETTLAADPTDQFRMWLAQAQQTEPFDATAAALATATAEGRPSGRMVLLKSVDARGFVFYTNYTSRKGNQLDANPHAAMVFFWSSVYRQVTVEGPAERVASDESDAYFASRPRGSQLSAWASPQSTPIARAELERRYAELDATYTNADVPRPPFWGGYRIVPELVVFWQGRPNRLHDRFCYRKEGTTWQIERLGP